MKHENTKKIKEHLEFLGFNVEDDSKDNEDNDSLAARHPSRYTLWVFSKVKFGSLAVFISGFDQAVAKEAEFLKVMSEVNHKSTFIKLSVTKKMLKDGLLMVDTYYLGYDKQQFGFIVDRFYEELDVYMKEFLVFATHPKMA